MKYFIADLHFEHERVLIGARKEHFPTIEQWNEGMIDAIRSRVTKRDTLFILGDMVMHGIKAMAKWRMRLVGDCWLIRGNHDPSVAACQRIFGKTRVRDTFDAELLGGHRCFLSHYAHAYWPSSHRGSFHCYGHNHGQREETLDALFPARRSMDVGPENIFRKLGKWGPISEVEILDLLEDQPGHDLVSFYHDLQGRYRTDSVGSH